MSSHVAQADVLIVGAGIVGCAHALAAVDVGHSVVILDRDTAPVGASIRNFGHACVTGQAGELADLASVARERWLEMSQRAGFFSVESGCLVASCSALSWGAELRLKSRIYASRFYFSHVKGN